MRHPFWGNQLTSVALFVFCRYLKKKNRIRTGIKVKALFLEFCATFYQFRKRLKQSQDLSTKKLMCFVVRDGCIKIADGLKGIFFCSSCFDAYLRHQF
jgi:hypothetical protein